MRNHFLRASLAAGVVAHPWDLAYATYSGNSFYIGTAASGDTASRSLFFKDDGTKMYVVGRTDSEVNQWSLSTAWDITTASFVQAKSVSGQDAQPTDVHFKDDGTQMYVLGNTNDRVYEYSLSTAWDISTASFVQHFSISSQETAPFGLFFKDDGTKMYVTGTNNDNVNEYSLSTAWDISTTSYVQNFSVATQDATPRGTVFKTDGTRMYVVGATGNDINEYSLSTAWNVSTASYVQNFSVASQLTSPYGVFFKTDGTKMYVSGVTDVYEYTF